MNIPIYPFAHTYAYKYTYLQYINIYSHMNKHLYVHLPMIYTHLLIHNAYNIYPYIMHTFLIELKFLGGPVYAA